MASRLAFIDGSEKAPLYHKVLGAELLTVLNVLQTRYESMVRARSTRNHNVSSLQKLRHKLQRHIQLYAAAVLTMFDEDEPESGEIVLDALRPMVNARIRRSRAAEVPDEQPEPVEAELDEVDEVEAPEAEAEAEFEFDDEHAE